MTAPTAVKERPVLFNAEMVRAVLAGRKTQTRRIVNTPAKLRRFFTSGPGRWTKSKTGEFHEIAYAYSNQVGGKHEHYFLVAGDQGWEGPIPCPYGRVGDHLYVRESFQPLLIDGFDWRYADYTTGRGYQVNYPATDGVKEYLDTTRGGKVTNRVTPSIHMPRWASRITLEVTEVRAERLQDMRPVDAIREGIGPYANSQTIDCETPNPRDEFALLWDSIHGNQPLCAWADNPWVWVVEFKLLNLKTTG